MLGPVRGTLTCGYEVYCVGGGAGAQAWGGLPRAAGHLPRGAWCGAALFAAASLRADQQRKALTECCMQSRLALGSAGHQSAGACPWREHCWGAGAIWRCHCLGATCAVQACAAARGADPASVVLEAMTRDVKPEIDALVLDAAANLGLTSKL